MDLLSLRPRDFKRIHPLAMKHSLRTSLAFTAIAPIVAYAGYTWLQHAGANLIIADSAVNYEFDLLLGIEGAASFSRTNFGDDDLKALVPSIRNHLNLTKLDFSGTQLTDVGLSYLQNLPNVATIDVRNTRVTDDGVAAAMPRLPDTIIRR